mmetsp:Transcript_3502/g.7637  ORF Transcript_3502/g.7637 Transcript_3502/m.7637 type:complete len:208 (-) Transcript_3502:1106-1729(-)
MVAAARASKTLVANASMLCCAGWSGPAARSPAEGSISMPWFAVADARALALNCSTGDCRVFPCKLNASNLDLTGVVLCDASADDGLHLFDDCESGLPATCAEDGLDLTGDCKFDCPAEYSEDGLHLLGDCESEVPAACAEDGLHLIGDWESALPAACAEDGLHLFGAWESALPAACAEDGLHLLGDCESDLPLCWLEGNADPRVELL